MYRVSEIYRECINNKYNKHMNKEINQSNLKINNNEFHLSCLEKAITIGSVKRR